LLRHKIAIVAFLALFWLANSGHYSGLLLFMGALSVALVTWLSVRMDVVDHESLPLHLFSRLPGYFAWLLGQIFASNLDLIRRIWRPGMDISPAVARLPLLQQSNVCRVVYANSINLTPGTLTISMDRDTLLVHALSAEGLKALDDGEMCHRVRELER